LKLDSRIYLQIVKERKQQRDAEVTLNVQQLVESEQRTNEELQTKHELGEPVTS
jgi:hypothetical protein